MLKGYKNCPLCRQLIEEDDFNYKEEYNKLYSGYKSLTTSTRTHIKALVVLLEESIKFIDSDKPKKAHKKLKTFLDSINKVVKENNEGL